MEISLETLRNTKGIGSKTLERIIEQHEIDNNIKSYKSKYIPSEEYQINEDINLWQGDCLKLMEHIPDKSVDMILTDPPYFLHGLGNDWLNVNDNITERTSKVVTNLPSGMRFDSNNSKLLYDYMYQVGKHYKRILKEGALGVAFTQARLTHNMAKGLEDAGLEIRELLFWKRKSIPKAQNLKRYGVDDNVLTPQPLQQLEVMILFRSPSNSFVDSYNKDKVGMMNYNRSTIYEVKHESNEFHPTQKPILLLEELLKQFTQEEMIVLDNTMGSGSTGVACKNLNRKFIGIELDKEYFNIAKERING